MLRPFNHLLFFVLLFIVIVPSITGTVSDGKSALLFNKGG